MNKSQIEVYAYGGDELILCPSEGLDVTIDHDEGQEMADGLASVISGKECEVMVYAVNVQMDRGNIIQVAFRNIEWRLTMTQASQFLAVLVEGLKENKRLRDKRK